MKYDVNTWQIQINQYFWLADGWCISDRIFKYRMSDIFLQESAIWDGLMQHAQNMYSAS